jgi:hypothetical protein
VDEFVVGHDVGGGSIFGDGGEDVQTALENGMGAWGLLLVVENVGEVRDELAVVHRLNGVSR